MSRSQKMVFKGKQVLLWGLVALVITAGYYRWNVETNQPESIPVTGEALPENVEAGDGSNAPEGSKGIGELRQERDQARGEAMEQWQKTTQNKDTSQEAKSEAETKIKQANTWTEQEKTIETLIKAKGYPDCFAHINESGISVIVSGGEINGAKVAQIKDVIVSETNLPVRKIKISSESF